MTSISGVTPNIQQGRTMMNARISSAAASGAISSADQTAFAKALDSIDSTLSAATSSSSSNRADGSMRTRMTSLIDAQVDAGTLTDEQATELKSLFEPGGDRSAAQGAGGPGGPGGPSGPAPMGPPPPPPSGAGQDTDDSTSSSDDDSTTTSSTTAASSDADAKLDAMMTFLTQLRETMRVDTSYDRSSYGAAGALYDVSA